jgi:hypothetical protein
MAKKAKGGRKTKQATGSPTGELGYGNVDSAGNMVLDYQELFGCTAPEMAEIIRRYTGEDWMGIGVDPHSGMGSFETVIEAVKREPGGVPVNVDGHAVVLCQISLTGNTVEYFDPGDNNNKQISLENLRENIRSAAVPRDLGEGITQTNSEQARLYEPAFD